ncbi:2501_t:CDS:1, partial [Dentiscutata erythropus]
VGKGKPTDSCKTLEIKYKVEKKDESFKAYFSVLKCNKSPVKQKNSAIKEIYKNN